MCAVLVYSFSQGCCLCECRAKALTPLHGGLHPTSSGCTVSVLQLTNRQMCLQAGGIGSFCGAVLPGNCAAHAHRRGMCPPVERALCAALPAHFRGTGAQHDGGGEGTMDDHSWCQWQQTCEQRCKVGQQCSQLVSDAGCSTPVGSGAGQLMAQLLTACNWMASHCCG